MNIDSPIQKSRRAWGPLGPTPPCRAAYDALPAGAFGVMVRGHFDPFWHLERDHPSFAQELCARFDCDDVAALAEFASDYEDEAPGIAVRNKMKRLPLFERAAPVIDLIKREAS